MHQSRTALKKSIVRKVFTTPGKNLILLLLAVKGEMHGYELLKEIENLTLGFWRPSHGYLYTLLNRMVEEGLLKAKEEFKGRVRRVRYELTRKGFEHLALANDVMLRILYNIVRTHEALRDKLRELAISDKPQMPRDVLIDYLKLLKQLRSILDERIAYLERRVRELEQGQE